MSGPPEPKTTTLKPICSPTKRNNPIKIQRCRYNSLIDYYCCFISYKFYKLYGKLFFDTIITYIFVVSEGSDRFRQVLRFTCTRDDKVKGVFELICRQIKFINQDSVVTGTFVQLSKIQVLVAVGTKEIHVYRAPHGQTL